MLDPFNIATASLQQEGSTGKSAPVPVPTDEVTKSSFWLTPSTTNESNTTTLASTREEDVNLRGEVEEGEAEDPRRLSLNSLTSAESAHSIMSIDTCTTYSSNLEELKHNQKKPKLHQRSLTNPAAVSFEAPSATLSIPLPQKHPVLCSRPVTTAVALDLVTPLTVDDSLCTPFEPSVPTPPRSSSDSYARLCEKAATTPFCRADAVATTTTAAAVAITNTATATATSDTAATADCVNSVTSSASAATSATVTSAFGKFERSTIANSSSPKSTNVTIGSTTITTTAVVASSPATSSTTTAATVTTTASTPTVAVEVATTATTTTDSPSNDAFAIAHAMLALSNPERNASQRLRNNNHNNYSSGNKSNSSSNNRCSNNSSSNYISSNISSSSNSSSSRFIVRDSKRSFSHLIGSSDTTAFSPQLPRFLNNSSSNNNINSNNSSSYTNSNNNSSFSNSNSNISSGSSSSGCADSQSQLARQYFLFPGSENKPKCVRKRPRWQTMPTTTTATTAATEIITAVSATTTAAVTAAVTTTAPTALPSSSSCSSTSSLLSSSLMFPFSTKADDSDCNKENQSTATATAATTTSATTSIATTIAAAHHRSVANARDLAAAILHDLREGDAVVKTTLEKNCLLMVLSEQLEERYFGKERLQKFCQHCLSRDEYNVTSKQWSRMKLKVVAELILALLADRLQGRLPPKTLPARPVWVRTYGEALGKLLLGQENGILRMSAAATTVTTTATTTAAAAAVNSTSYGALSLPEHIDVQVFTAVFGDSGTTGRTFRSRKAAPRSALPFDFSGSFDALKLQQVSAESFLQEGAAANAIAAANGVNPYSSYTSVDTSGGVAANATANAGVYYANAYQ